MATLYTCNQRDRAAAVHPCGKAAKALRDAGHAFEIETVGGYKALGFTRRGKRDRIRELTGQEDVPVFVDDGGAVVHGTKTIVAWAKAHPAA
jgi:hypothetical protein